MKPIVEIENLSKLFRLGTIGASSVRESLETLLRRKPAEWKQKAPLVISADQFLVQ